MKTKPEQLKELLDSIEYQHLMDIIDHPWYISGESVCWNTDDNLKDLAFQENNTFSGWLPEGTAEWEGFTITNYDTGCGQWITLLLNNDKQVCAKWLEDNFDCDIA